MLAVVAFAELDAGDLGDGIGFVGLFQRTGQEEVLPDRLRAVARIDAARAEKAQALHTGQPGTVNQVGLDHQVLVDEVGAQRVVGVDAADDGGRNENEVGFLPGQKGMRRGLIEQVQRGTVTGQDVSVAGLFQPAHQRGADHAAMTGDVDLRGSFHHS